MISSLCIFSALHAIVIINTHKSFILGKMKSCFFLLHYFFLRTFIIFLLAVSLSNCDYTNYEACNITYNCKNIQVGYPFWGDNRPKLCGTQDLKLSCKGDSTDSSTIINVFQNGYSGLNVLRIDASSHNMVVNQTNNLFELCGDNNQRKNITLISSLKPVKGYKDVHLVHNCVTTCNVAVSHTKFIECSDGVKKTAYYDLYNRSNLDNIRKRCSCSSSVTFPIDERALDEFKIPNVTLQSVLRKWPNITLKYEANFTACSKCSSSGGRCGSLDDSSQGGFVCYCQDGPQPQMCRHSDRKKKLAVALGSGIGGVFVLGAIVAIWLYMKQKLGSSKFIDHSDSLDSSASEREKGSRYYGVPLFSYRELVEATNNFDQSNELGDGGFGIVYHGKLKDGREVAVKRLYEKNYRRIEQFMNEIHILTNLRHHNLVSLYGCTSQHCRELLLVYEYVSNGTVADHLFSKSTTSRSSLPWPVRLKIAVETATALSYLHASDIIHRDVKTNNILLDRNFCVKVADFGLSRLFPTDVTHVSTAPQGTPGYLDPEYHQCYQLTDKSDVYSFGVVLIELVSSLPAIDMDRHRHEINLSNYATNRIQRGAFDELVDPQLGFATDFRVRRMTISVAELAFQCLQHDKNFRPSMDEVLEVLKRIEGADYEALLQAEEKAKEAAEKVVNLHSSSLPPPPSPTEGDHQQLLRNHQLHSLHPPSPISVIEHWVSRSTTPSNSK